MSITSINSNATAVLQKQLEQMAGAEGICFLRKVCQ